MTRTNRVFLSFATKDKTYRTFLIGQAKRKRSPFELIDVTIKEPWDEQWRTHCRSRIQGCDGVIALVSEHYVNDEGALWEIRCAKEEKKPVRGIYCTTDNRPVTLPAEFDGVTIDDWTSDKIERFVNSLSATEE